MPPVVKNLLIINGLFFLATIALQKSFGIDLVNYLGLHLPQSDHFKPIQFISYIFMHSTFNGAGQLVLSHIGFNMFALWMFGNSLENYWGGKRFLIYYLITGMGAGLIHLGVQEFQALRYATQLTSEQIAIIHGEGYGVIQSGQYYTNVIMNEYNIAINTATVGASGSVFGILLAFGMMFPNAQIYLYFLFPIKAKYFVMLYGAFELYSGIQNAQGDNVAHFAHLGGMLFGFIMLKYWQKNNSQF